ncbi:Ppx/GppA family phosphatase [Sphingomonas sp. ID1715]|uniref:Ppx/GppA family phosphatase n=1 Tax=Sphingomonas sp. ID1715 TaxID=1656898 RepID=UPI0014897760|nr:Ppx/GppA family phosphatase [Sphingomonas sp. ID1715]NNM75567.1 Ppx/GppA family phosphatase [Sphingomonas sp. ID1715]
MSEADLIVRDVKVEADAIPARQAIIDIGSNSIRLVVYGGPPRIPATLFNEKVMAGLGRSLDETGAIAPAAIETAARALARFKTIADLMHVDRLRTVATAAVRDASNGAVLLGRAAAIGLDVELLTGEQEAEAAAMGVLAAMPGADGIVGDLGGGSLELSRIAAGRVLDRASFPLGVLRIAALRSTKGALERTVREQLGQTPWLASARRLPLFLVGGSWRALARVDMALSTYPLPIVHGYMMAPSAAPRLARTIAATTREELRMVPSLSGSRIANLGEASALLAVLVRELQSKSLIVSAYGLREGLLFAALPTAVAAEDPLIAACREEGHVQGRFPEHGDLLDRWIAPLFPGGTDARLRLAACLLADTGWRANPEFRAERAFENGAHGNWVGIDARGRVLLGQALFTALGGGADALGSLATLASAQDLRRAVRWGLAIRLGQRLSGGVAEPLRRTSIAIDGKALVLQLNDGDRALYGDAVDKRFRQLASEMGLEPRVG